jgi:hypothetical protein
MGNVKIGCWFLRKYIEMDFSSIQFSERKKRSKMQSHFFKNRLFIKVFYPFIGLINFFFFIWKAITKAHDFFNYHLWYKMKVSVLMVSKTEKIY